MGGEYERSILKVWYAKRKRLGMLCTRAKGAWPGRNKGSPPPPATRKGAPPAGGRPSATPEAEGSSSTHSGSPKNGSGAAEFEAPEMIIYNTQTMQDLKKELGRSPAPNKLTPTQVLILLTSFGLHSIRIMSVASVKQVFTAISRHLTGVSKDSPGRPRVGWAQICPRQLLDCDSEVLGVSIPVQDTALFPPWHRSATQKGHARRCGALLIGATFDDNWRWRLRSVYLPLKLFGARTRNVEGELPPIPAAAALKR